MRLGSIGEEADLVKGLKTRTPRRVGLIGGLAVVVSHHYKGLKVDKHLREVVEEDLAQGVVESQQVRVLRQLLEARKKNKKEQ